CLSSFHLIPRPPLPPLFPYTTLFRSLAERDAAATRFVPVEVTSEPATQASPDGAPGALELILSAGWRLQIGPGFDAPTLRRLLRSEEHTSELQSPCNLVCRLLLEKKK